MARDLSFLLPGFGLGLGVLLLRGPVPRLGLLLLALCLTSLAVRLHHSLRAYHRRKRVTALIEWHRVYRANCLKRQKEPLHQ